MSRCGLLHGVGNKRCLVHAPDNHSTEMVNRPRGRMVFGVAMHYLEHSILAPSSPHHRQTRLLFPHLLQHEGFLFPFRSAPCRLKPRRAGLSWSVRGLLGDGPNFSHFSTVCSIHTPASRNLLLSTSTVHHGLFFTQAILPSHPRFLRSTCSIHSLV